MTHVMSVAFKDSGHSVSSVGGRLQLKHAYTYDPWKSGWTSCAVQAQCGNPLGKWTHTQLARECSSTVISAHCGTDPQPKTVEVVSGSPLKRKKKQRHTTLSLWQKWCRDCHQCIFVWQLFFLKIATVAKREELYASLYKKSSEIYIQRSKQMYGNGAMRTQLLTWLMEDLEIVALADMSYHGRENVINVMKDIDKDRWGNGLTHCIYYSSEKVINIMKDIDKDR